MAAAFRGANRTRPLSGTVMSETLAAAERLPG